MMAIKEFFWYDRNAYFHFYAIKIKTKLNEEQENVRCVTKQEDDVKQNN